jgi:glyoxylase-like metal-dependent hydrolase (beta-lactamase superfamily II)
MADLLLSITPQVWVFPCDDDDDAGRVQPSVGIICTTRHTILVDAGNSPAHAHRVRAALHTLKAPPVQYLIYTHHHWDHVFGAQVFGVPAIAHEHCRECLLPVAEAGWSRQDVAQRSQQEPRRAASSTAVLNALGDQPDLQIWLPSFTFSQRMRLSVDDLTIELEHVGGQHAPDSVIVRVPEAGVLFLGDCYYPPPLHLRTAPAAPDWAMLDSLVNDRYQWYIEGHDRPHALMELRKALAGMKVAPTE